MDTAIVLPLLVLIAAPVALALLMFLLKVSVRYEIGEEAFRVIFMGFPTVSVKYRRIVKVEKVSFLKAFFVWRRQNWARRLSGPYVLIETVSGLFNRIIITPDDATAFLKEIEARLPK